MNNLEKAKEDFERFFTLLKSAIWLAGGYGDDRWRDMTLEEIYTGIHPNGIQFSFKLDLPEDKLFS